MCLVAVSKPWCAYWRIIFAAAIPRDGWLAHNADNTTNAVSIPPLNSSACLERMQQYFDLSAPIKIHVLAGLKTLNFRCWMQVKRLYKRRLGILQFLDPAEKAQWCDGLESEVPEDRNAPTSLLCSSCSCPILLHRIIPHNIHHCSCFPPMIPFKYLQVCLSFPKPCPHLNSCPKQWWGWDRTVPASVLLGTQSRYLLLIYLSKAKDYLELGADAGRFFLLMEMEERFGNAVMQRQVG